MSEALHGYAAFIDVIRKVLFVVAVVVALIALVDWAARTRRINPFGPIARFFRRFVDPLMAPVERRIVRRGGLPANAPWWSLVVVVVGGLLLVTLLEFMGGIFRDVALGVSSPALFARLLVSWAFAILRIALIVRVISSWFSVSPYSRWIRWSYVLTEWMLAPLRRVMPTFGPVDITPLIAFVLLAVLENVLVR